MRCLNKEKFTSLEVAILSFFMMNSFLSFILVKLFDNTPTINIIISILLSFVIGFILIKFYIKAFDKVYLVNSNIIIKFLLVILSLFFAIYSVFNVSSVIKEVILPNMSQNIICLTFLIIATILSVKGIKSISIASNLMLIIYIIVAVISFLFNLVNVNHINLLPITLNLDNIPFIKILLLTISPLFMLLIIPKKEFINFNKYRKYLHISYFIFYGYFLIKVLFIISILGIKYFSFIDYPEITVLKMINIFNFFERLEELLIINMFIQGMITTSLSINYGSTLLNSIFKLDKKAFIMITVLLFIILLNINILNNNILYLGSFLFVIVNLFNYVFFSFKKNK